MKAGPKATQRNSRVMLIASPHADATPYRRSVVLVVEHDERGTVGVILDGTFQRSVEQAREQLGQVVRDRQAGVIAAVPVRIATWPPGALEIEVKNGLWMTAPATSDMIFSKQSNWHELVRGVGRTVYRDALNIRHFPDDPRLN